MSTARSYKGLSGICIFIVFVGTAFAGGSQAPYKSDASGSFSSSVIDSNGDGIPGVVGVLQGQSNFGAVTITFFSEFDISAAAPSGNCPEGYLELPLVTSKTIHTYRNGDLLFFETTSEIFCGNPMTGQFQWNESLAVIGGTGRFANASGILETAGSGVILVSDVLGATNFGGVSLRDKGNISLNR